MPSSRAVEEDLALDPARQQRVLDLQVGDGVDGGGAAQRVRADLREADVADEAGLDHLGDRSDGLLDRHRLIEPRRAVDVDVVRAEPPQRLGEGVLRRGRAGVEAHEGAERVAQAAVLDAEDHVVAAAVLERACDQQLVVARAVEVAGVDQGHPGVDGGVNGGDALALVGGSVEVGHPHRAEADGRDVGAVAGKGACVHAAHHGERGATSETPIPRDFTHPPACLSCASCAPSSRWRRS